MSEQGVIEIRVATLEAAVGEIKTAVNSIDGSMKAIVRLEEHHAHTRDSVNRAFSELSDHETRLRALENDAPSMRLVRGWVLAWVLGIVAIVCVAIIALVIPGMTS
jgi:hypothetical protein